MDDPEEVVSAQSQSEETTSTEVTPNPGASAPFDTKAFATEFAAALAPALKPVEAAPQPKQYTPEEIDAALGRWKPDATWKEKFDNLESRDEAVLAMRDGFMQQADRLAQIRTHQAIEQLRQQFAPLIQQQEAARVEQAYETFGKAYPQFASPKLRPLADRIAEGLMSGGKKFASSEEFFSSVASGMAEVARETNPNFVLTPAASAGSSSGTKTVSNPNAVRGNSFGSGGGAGGGRLAAAGGEKKAIASLFDA